MFDTVDATAAEIRDMKIRGAGRIARAGAGALKEFAETYKGNSLESFRKDLNTAKDRLLASRPTAVSLWNGLQSSVKGVASAETAEDAKASVITNADAFIESSAKAAELISKIGSKRIENGDVVITHCNSSAAVGVIREAHLQGKDIKVYATESRPWRQGLITVRELSDAGVDITLMIDSAANSIMKKADKVFVGADTVTSNGALINKIGTSQLALSAYASRVSFNVCTETYKFSPMTLFGDMVKIEERNRDEVVRPNEIPDNVKIYNPVFDSTPAKHIDALITELGIMSPGSVYDVMVRQLGEEIFDMRDRS